MGRHYCIFVANYLPNLGGVERYTLNLAQKLVERGNWVTIVTSNVFRLPEWETTDNIEVFRLPCKNLLNGRFPVFLPGRKSHKMLRSLEQKTYDFVIIQTRFYIHSWLGARFARRKGIPRIVIEHGTNHFTVNNPFWDRLGHVYEHWITQRVKTCCRDFYGVSQACCEWLKHFQIDAKGVLYNAVDPEQILQERDKADVNYRDEYGGDSKTLVCYCGRLVPEKGIQKLTAAIEELNKNGISAELLVAGDGDLMETLKETNQPHVHLLGKLDFTHVAALYRDSDIFCLPTDYPEGFPTSVLEAAASSCFVITTPRGGSRELIIDDDYGIILEENTAENLAAAIRKAAEDPEYRRRATGNAYERLCELFTWDRICSKVETIEKEMSLKSQKG